MNADDFGLTAGVNRAIAELHRAGIVTSASLMARAFATNEAIELARSMPTLGMGCHVDLVDGEPVLPADQIPTLVDRRTGGFLRSLGVFLPLLFTGRIRSAEIEAEAAAQIALLKRKGVRLTHVDTHKHTHIFSAVLRPVLRAAAAAGIRAIRHPFEPAWAVHATPRASFVRIAEITALRTLDPRFRRTLAQAGFATTDGTIAMAGTGTLDGSALRSLLKKLPAGTWELVTHPGYNDAELAKVDTRLRASREVERQALQAIREFPALELVSFADLAEPSRAAD